MRGDVTSAEIIYLQEGTSYNIRVLAENVAGLSEPTELEEAIVPKSPYSESLEKVLERGRKVTPYKRNKEEEYFG